MFSNSVFARLARRQQSGSKYKSELWQASFRVKGINIWGNA